MDYGYGYGDYGLTASDSAAVGALTGVFLIFFLVMMAICITCAVLVIIGQWKIFKKGNQPGWAALIPFYNTYCMCKVVGINPWWILIVCLSPILGIIPIVGSLASAIVSIYFTILLAVSLARSFGKSDGYAVGIILLAPIFYFLLGRDKEQYLGPKPMHDIVFDDWFKQNNNTTNMNNNAVPEANVSEENNQSRFCPNCGSKIEGDTKFCPSCGKEV